MTALIFDCDGVLADTERYGHLPAFNATFEQFGLPVRWSEDDYAEKLRIGGGKERMASLFADPGFVREAGVPDGADERAALLAQWHTAKTAHFTQLVQEGALPGRPGVRRLIHDALEAGWRVAVASTSAEASVTAVLRHAAGEEAAARIPVFAGDVVPAKKPDPAIYLLAVERLGLDPADALVVEDSRNGLLAARRAGLACLVTVSSYTGGEDFSEASLVVSELGDPDGPPVEVLADPFDVHPGHDVDLDAVRRLLRARAEQHDDRRHDSSDATKESA